MSNHPVAAPRPHRVRGGSVALEGVVVALCGATLAVGMVVGRIGLMVVVLTLSVALAAGWARLVDSPSADGTALVVGVSGVGAAVSIHLTSQPPWLGTLPLVAALGLVLAAVSELLRPEPRARLVESLSATVLGSLAAISASGWQATARVAGGESAVMLAAAGFVLAGALTAGPVRSRWHQLAAVVGAAAGTALVAWATSASLLLGVLMGALCGALVVASRAMTARSRAARSTLGSVSAAVLPVCLAGVVVYALARLMLLVV